ncbi:MAG: ABC transporter substrate-binding protein [Eubacteriales bacterium]|nr:ABC transporter substrate-binding protein [Eubacteriales bacterium]
MKIRKRILTAALALAMTAGLLSGCGKKEDANAKKKIGIIQLVEHDSLDAARKGFTDGLAEAGYNDGAQIEIDYQNANGDQANNNTIADKFANDDKDLILAIATPSAQAVANKIKDTPILFTAVTDPVSAGLVADNEKVGGNVTGTSDKIPIEKQLDMLFDLKQEIKKVGLLYCSAEDNSIAQIAEAKDILKARNIEFTEITVQNANDVQSVLESAIDKVDAIYTPTDNAIATAMSTVAQIAVPKKVPVVAGAVEMVQKGGAGTVGLDYYTLGKQTAEMAVKILKDGMKAENLPVEFSKEDKIELNEEIIGKLGLTVPEKYVK